MTSAQTHSRVAFLDLARLIATLMMVQGHTTDALLGAAHRSGLGFETWGVIRGLTSPTFLFVSGCVFGLVTVRQLGQVHFREAAIRRLRRFGFFLLVGYALHFPKANLPEFLAMNQGEWRVFLAIDTLQCIAVSLGLLQLVALRVHSRLAFVSAAAGVAIGVWVLAPVVWWYAGGLGLPEPLVAYLSPAVGSLFPLFPWVSYVALGAAVGAMSGSTVEPARPLRQLAPLGVLLVVCGVGVRALGLESDAVIALSAARPSQVLLQIGAVCLLLSGLVLVSATIRHGRLAAVASVAQESLLIYVVHLCVVYGSPWNDGLRHAFGTTLSPLAVASIVVVMWVSMGGLAVLWVRWKRLRPQEARVARNVTLGLLLLLLLV